MAKDDQWKWLPHFIAASDRLQSVTAEDLLSGRAWEELSERVSRLGQLILGKGAPEGSAERAAGFRHLLGLLGLAVDQALRWSDPYEPQITPALMDQVYKWGMDCPDALYSGTPIRSDATYRIQGYRGSARYLGFQVMSGIASTVNLVADDLKICADGSFELILGGERRSDNWMELPAGAGSLVVRQFFYDWEREEPAQLEIERIAGDRAATVPPEPTPERVARKLAAIGDFLEASVRFWMDLENSGRAQGLNRFRSPEARTAMGAAAENVSVWGSFQLGGEEALLIEVEPPPALYWSVSLGNFWWETLDYANHQTSLNGHQAVLDPDGVFRAVVAHRDPGVANWLDTTGQSCGPMIFRWLRADEAPVPRTRLLSLSELDAALPASTARVDSRTRSRQLAVRRAHVRRRFSR
ncbi:MAG: DUF1214 domain-containing protein [Myxococcota bacterium]